jgi:hypothetical protein
VAQDPFKNVPGAGAARFVGAVFGFVFAGIGVTVLVFMWGSSFDDFDSPPLFVRIFASFIAIAFVAVDAGMGITALRGGGELPSVPAGSAGTAGPTSAAPAGGYTCPNCGAPLGGRADVSPSGAV